MEGYSKLASLMGAYPETLIFRRFGAIGAQNLLYLQAELVHLEQRLQECAVANERSGDQSEKNLLSKDWFTLAHSSEGNEQWHLVLQIRAKLKEYGDALLQRSMLQQQQEPNPQDLASLQEWMKRPTMGGVYLLGRDSHVWEDPVAADLIALKAYKQNDWFSSWITTKFIRIYHRIIGRYHRKPSGTGYSTNTVHYSEECLLRAAALIAMSCASLMPIAAITILYNVTNMPARLGLVATFTVAFTFLCGTLTSARAIDIFAATTAFAAVQVVFIGTSPGRG